MKHPRLKTGYMRFGLVLLSGLVLCAFLGLGLHVVFDAAHHHFQHAHHHHHEGHGHGEGGGHGEHAPYDCAYCAVLGTFVFLLVTFLGVPALVQATKCPLVPPPLPRIMWDVACAHLLRGPPLAHLS